MDVLSASAYAKFSLGVLRVAGVVPWTPVRLWQRYLHQVYSTFVVASAAFLQCTILVYLALNFNDKRVFMKDLWMRIGSSVLNLQIILFVIKRNDLMILLRNVPLVVRKFELNENLKIYQKKALSYCLLYFATTSFILIMTTLNTDTLNSGKDKSVGNKNFENFLTSLIINEPFKLIVKLFQHFTGIIFAVFHIGFTSLYIYLLTLIHGYLQHLKEAITKVNIRKTNRSGCWLSGVNSNIYDIRYCVTMHQFIISLVDQTNAVFSLQLLLKVWHCLLTMCLSAFELTSANAEPDDYLMSMTVFIVAPLDLFNSCWNSENIKETSERLTACCAAQLWRGQGWVSGDRRSLMVLGARCNVPLQITAGPFYRLNLDTFSALVALSFSYYMFLRNMATTS